MTTVYWFSNACLTFQVNGLKQKRIKRPRNFEHVAITDCYMTSCFSQPYTETEMPLWQTPLGGSEFDNIETNRPHCKQSSHKTAEKHFTALPLVPTVK